MWRSVIPHVCGLGRCIALDLIGMGRSEKPTLGYRFADHARYVDAAIESLGLERLVLVSHDWGSTLAFHYARRHETNVRALAFMECILQPFPGWETFPAPVAELFRSFRTPQVGHELVLRRNVFIEEILPAGVMRPLSEEELSRYRDPFPDEPSRVPLLRWPNEIPVAGEPADVAEEISACWDWLQETPLPKLLLHASPGALIPPPAVELAQAKLRELQTVPLGAGIHHLHEDHPHAIGLALARWLESLPAS